MGVISHKELLGLLEYNKDNGNFYWNYQGVCYDISTKSYKSYIKFEGKIKHLGRFKTKEEAQKCYDDFCFKNFGHNNRKAGSLDIEGYERININKKAYKSHNLAWFYVYGEMPNEREIDHIDRNPTNNKIDNLRRNTFQNNLRNKGLYKNNKIGFKGVSKINNKFISSISVNRSRIKLGKFDSAKEAAVEYDKAALYYFGEFACTNKMLGLI